MALELSGEHVFPVERRKLWVYLNDPEVLALCIPGCTGMVQTGEDAYEANLKLQVASVGGTFKGSIALSDKVEPETCRITVPGSGTIGHGTGNARFEQNGSAACRDRVCQDLSNPVAAVTIKK